MERPDVGLAQSLHRGEVGARNRAAPEARIDLLRGHGGRREGDIDADGPTGLIVWAASPISSSRPAPSHRPAG